MKTLKLSLLFLDCITIATEIDGELEDLRINGFSYNDNSGKKALLKRDFLITLRSTLTPEYISVVSELQRYSTRVVMQQLLRSVTQR
jgi:hypothetical protein